MVFDLITSLSTDSIPELSSSRYGFTSNCVVEEEESKSWSDEEEKDSPSSPHPLDVVTKRMTLKGSKGFSSVLMVLSYVHAVSDSEGGLVRQQDFL